MNNQNNQQNTSGAQERKQNSVYGSSQGSYTSNSSSGGINANYANSNSGDGQKKNSEIPSRPHVPDTTITDQSGISGSNSLSDRSNPSANRTASNAGSVDTTKRSTDSSSTGDEKRNRTGQQ